MSVVGSNLNSTEISTFFLSYQSIQLTPLSTAHTIVHQLCRMAQLRNYDNLSLHEVICQKSLERPMHPSEIVIETVLRWSIWDIDERKDNYLILKKNTLYPALIPYVSSGIWAIWQYVWVSCSC